MVAYVFTPWREPSELLAVRRQFYRAQTQQQQQQQQSQQQAQASRKRQRDEDEGEVGEDENKWWAEQTHQHRAVARVSTWVQRGNCPHMVESTALLMAAILSDEQQQHQQQQKQQQAMAGGSGGSGGSGGHGPIDGAGLAAAWPQGLASTSPSSSYAVRAAYSAAFSRFVTGLLDSHQDKQRKMSMYAIAKSVGLPATFVELRHQATHEQLPSVTRLRAAARKALRWIWDYYWTHLPAAEQRHEGPGAEQGVDSACRALVLRYVHAADGSPQQDEVLAQTRTQDPREVLLALDAVGDAATESRVLRKVVALTSAVLDEQLDRAAADAVQAVGEVEAPVRDVDAAREAVEAARRELEDVVRLAVSRVGPDEKDEDDIGDEPGWVLYENWTPKPIGVV